MLSFKHTALVRGLKGMRKVLSKKISRRQALGTASKVAISAVVAGVIAGTTGFLAGSSLAPTVTKKETTTITQAAKTLTTTVTETVTKTITAGTTITETPTTIATVTETPPVTTPPTKVTVEVLSYDNPETPEGAALMKGIEEFESLYPQIDIVYRWVPFKELVPTILRLAAVKKLPEVVFADNPDIPYLAKSGIFMDITSFVEKWGEWEEFNEGSRLATTLNGRIYAIHFWTNNVALWYNKEYFSRAGVTEPPKTWEDLLEACRKIKERVEGVFPIAFSAIDSEEGTWQFEPFLWSNGGSLLELDQPEAIEALELWTTLVKEGYAPSDVMNWTQGDAAHQFTAKKVAMVLQGNWDITRIRKTADFEYGVTYIPVPSKDMKLPIVPLGGECFGISSNCPSEKIDEAWEFVKYWGEEEPMAKYCIRCTAVPTRKLPKNLEEKVLMSASELQVFIQQAKTALPRPLMGGHEKYTEVSAITRTYMQRALSGVMTPEDAFKKAAKEIRQLFSTEEEYEEARTAARRALEKVLAIARQG